MSENKENLEVIDREVGECNFYESIRAMLHRAILGRHALEAFGLTPEEGCL